jgi:hypothetical protein
MGKDKEENLKIAWFGDTNSHGYRKIKGIADIYMEVKEGTASEAFQKYFGRNPDNMSCECCCEDFIYDEYDTLKEASSFHRERKDYMPLSNYMKLPEVLFVPYTLYQEKVGETPKKSKKSRSKSTVDIVDIVDMEPTI